MKFNNSFKSTKRWISTLLMYYIFAIPVTTNAQSKLNVGIGADLNELYNISIRYQAEQTQYALGIGTLSAKYENILSISASWYYHFHGVSTYTSRRPWYGKVVMNYLRYEYLDFSPYDKRERLLIGLRVGRDFNLSKRLAINSDIGFNLGSFDIDYGFPFSSGIWLFYRL